MHKYSDITLEAVTWIVITIFTLIVVAIFPWDVAENLLRNIAIVTGAAAVFWYLKSRRLFEESLQKTRELTAQQKEITNRQKTIDLIFDNAADGILILDSQQRIASFSPGLVRMTGYAAEEVVGRTIKEALHFNGDSENSLLPDVMFLPNTVSRKPHVKNTLTTKDGREIDIEANCTLIRGTAREGDKALAIIRDMTYENELVRRDKEFIAVTSHQLNTPLSIIQGYAALIKSGRAGDITKKQEHYLTEILTSVKKMISLTGSMLSISRIEEEKVKLMLTDVNIGDLFEKLEQGFDSQAKLKGLKLSFPQITQSLLVYADEDKLYQAIANLIDNAIHYTNHGEIKIDLTKKSDELTFSVSDTGIGIPEDELAKIGQKFYRSQDAITVNSHGTGLGIFIAKTIVEKHGGSLTLTSKHGKGSCFTFTIPTHTPIAH